MKIIQEYINEMKETSYIIVVTKSIVRNRHWEESILRSILVFSASKQFIRSMSYKELKF